MHHIKTTYDKILSALNDVLVEKSYILKSPVRPGPKHKFTDIDVIALSLTADFIGVNSENYLFTSLNSDYKNYFPNLLSRRQFNDRRKKLENKINQLRAVIGDKMKKARMSQHTYVIDSMPLRLCKFARRFSSTICKDNPNLIPKISWCAAQEEWYYGFKLNVICTEEGIIKKFKIGDSTIHDIHYLDEIGEEFKWCRIVGDKGYISQGRKIDFLNQYKIHLETPPKRNQKNKDPFIWGHVRKRIEVLFSQLNNQFQIQRNFAKTIIGYITRLYSKLCTITLMQYINKNKSKPVSRVQYALA